MNKKLKGYLANGLFSLGDRFVNSIISKEIKDKVPNIDLYVPQENNEINDKTKFANSLDIFKADSERILESDFLIAVIDGCEIDSGVAAEIGMFYMCKKPIYALFTDVRTQGRDNQDKINALINDGTENQFIYRNLFVVGLIKKRSKKIYDNITEMVSDIKNDFEKGYIN